MLHNKYDFHLNWRPHHHTVAAFYVSHCLTDCMFHETFSVQSSLLMSVHWTEANARQAQHIKVWEGWLFPLSSPGNCPSFRPEVILFTGSSCLCMWHGKSRWPYVPDPMITYPWITRNQVVLASWKAYTFTGVGGVVVQVEPSPVCHLPPFCSQKEGSVKVICSPVGEHPFSASPLDPHNNHHDNSTLQEHGCFEFTKQLYNQCPIWLSHQHSNIGQARISNCLL